MNITTSDIQSICKKIFYAAKEGLVDYKSSSSEHIKCCLVTSELGEILNLTMSPTSSIKIIKLLSSDKNEEFMIEGNNQGEEAFNYIKYLTGITDIVSAQVNQIDNKEYEISLKERLELYRRLYTIYSKLVNSDGGGFDYCHSSI